MYLLPYFVVTEQSRGRTEYLELNGVNLKQIRVDLSIRTLKEQKDQNGPASASQHSSLT